MAPDADGNRHLDPPCVLRLDPKVDPDALYRGYIHPSRRDSQALPPDPPPFRQFTPPSSPSLSRAPCPGPESVGAGGVIPASPALSPAASPVPGSQSSLPAPSSPVESTPPTQISPSPVHTFTTPSSRNHSQNYEAALIALSDVNRLSRYLFRGGVHTVVQHWDPTGVPTTKEDVLDVLAQLKEMLDRLFAKNPSRFA